MTIIPDPFTRPPRPDPFTRSYKDQGINDLIVTVAHIAEKAKDHIAFQGPLAEYISTSDKLMEHVKSLTLVRDANIGRGKGLTPEEKALMASAIRALDYNARHINMLSQYRNDPSILLNTGYELKDLTTSKPKPNILDMVPEVEAKHILGVPGGVLIVLKKEDSRDIVELQMTETPDDPDSWKGCGEGSYRKCRIEVRGQQPTKRLYFRARYVEHGAVGRWSNPVDIIVL